MLPPFISLYIFISFLLSLITSHNTTTGFSLLTIFLSFSPPSPPFFYFFPLLIPFFLFSPPVSYLIYLITSNMEDEWVKSAMVDDHLVVELLIRLKESEWFSSPLPAKLITPPPLVWGVRQPRSRQQVLRSSNNIVNTTMTTSQEKKLGESTRASPTTPLSWSGGASFSGGGGGDCYEESSLLASKQLNGVRSKAIGSGETSNRKSRKKKTFAELKEAESFLLKEITEMKQEMVLLQSIVQERRIMNESLKRKKVNLQLQSAKRTCAGDVAEDMVCDQSCQAELDRISTILTSKASQELGIVLPSSRPHESHEALEKDVAPCQSSFVLPDLNMPFGEDSCSEDLYGMS